MKHVHKLAWIGVIFVNIIICFCRAKFINT